MFSEQEIAAADEKARKTKKSLKQVLGADRILCNCSRCKLKQKHRPIIVERHRLLYGLMENCDGESAPLDHSSKSPGPSRRRSRHSSPLYAEPHSHDSTRAADPISINASPVASPIDDTTRTPSPRVDGNNGTDLDPRPLPPSLPPFPTHSANTEDGLPAAPINYAFVSIRKPQPRAYTAKSRREMPKFDPRQLRLSYRRPDWELLGTPKPIPTGSPVSLVPPDPGTVVDEALLERFDLPRYYSVSPLLSGVFDPTGTPISVTPIPTTPLCNSPAPEDDLVDTNDKPIHSIDPEEDQLFYRNLLDEEELELPPDWEHDDLANRGEPQDPGNGVNEDDAGNDPEPVEAEPDLPGLPVTDQDFDDDPDELDAPLSAAFQEHPCLRNIYLRTYLDAAFRGSTKEQIRSTLLSQKLSLEAVARISPLPQALLDDLAKMPLTLRALQRRLGMDTLSLIRIYTLCSKCGKRYSAEAIKTAAHPGCTRYIGDTVCNTPLYREETLYGGVRKRNPIKSFPYFPLLVALERVLMHPGMKELMRHYLHDQDPIGVAAPLSREDWEASVGDTNGFGDITEGWGWWSEPVGLGRSYREEDQDYGDDVPDTGLHALASMPLGLSLALNTDGFQAFKNGKYSTNGVYIIINNLPFYLRTLIENMMLLIVMPGPNEPPTYEFGQIMEPLIDDLILLEKGQYLRVYNMELGRPEKELVHAHLSLAIVDHIARIKVCGHAGTKSEHHFCLYCTKQRSYLSVPEGFQDLELRDPQERLNDKHAWLRASAEEKENLRRQTGVTFTQFDRLPGWYAADNCPIDAMHLFHLGTTRHICQAILIKSGLLNPTSRHQSVEEQPFERFDAFVARTVFPSFCQRKPPKFQNMTSSVKAEQWDHLSVILYVALFEAWRVGDTIPDGNVPRGGKHTKVYKFQQSQARELCRNRCIVHTNQGGSDDTKPTLSDCVSSRNRRLIFRNILRYVLALQLLLRHRISREDVSLAQRLLARVAIVFTKMNLLLTPNFHYMMHVEESILKFGSLYGTWTFPFERANRLLINTNNNGHTLGALEATMARGFLKRTGCNVLVRQMQELPNPTQDDIATTNMMLAAMRDGPEHERQRGMLNAILAGEARFRVQEQIRLATTSSDVNWNNPNHRMYWDLVMDYCSAQLHGHIVYGYGQRPHGGIRLAPKGSTRSLPHIHSAGLRYGAESNRRGFSSRYGYIHGRVPVLIKQIYRAVLVIEDEERSIVCAIVQRFKAPAQRFHFPWAEWKDRLEVESWAFGDLEDPEAIGVEAFSGVHAVSDIDMPSGHYWLTFAMKPTEPEPFEG